MEEFRPPGSLEFALNRDFKLPHFENHFEGSFHRAFGFWFFSSRSIGRKIHRRGFS